MSTEPDLKLASIPPPLLSGSDRRTYEALFHHPSSHNLKWRDVIHLFEELGSVTEKAKHEYVFTVGDVQQVLRRPHSKDLTSEEIRDLRHFLAGSVLDTEAETSVKDSAVTNATDFMIVMDHHDARIFKIEAVVADDSKRDIRPYDPHHFLHHLTHKDQPRERGQRAHEDTTFCERIAQAAVNAQRTVIVGRGTGNSDAAHHLVVYIREHHAETAQKILFELTPIYRISPSRNCSPWAEKVWLSLPTPQVPFEHTRRRIGEPEPAIRRAVRARMAWLGIQLDSAASSTDAMCIGTQKAARASMSSPPTRRS